MRMSVAALLFLFCGLMFEFIFDPAGAGQVEGGQGDQAPDIRYLLQQGGGLAAYADLPVLPLEYVRPLFAGVSITDRNYLAGSYILAGRTDMIPLAMGPGWAVAVFQNSIGVQHMFDCPMFNRNSPGVFSSLPEIAIREIASALHVTPTISYYDFRNPDATGITFHWLHMRTSGQAYGSLTLPLENTYVDRGYVFCTNIGLSNMSLNGAAIDQASIVSNPVRRYRVLRPDQLRAGQANSLQVGSTSGWYDSTSTSILGGVMTVYSGTATLQASGGYTRTLALAWPAVLGQPVEIRQVYLPEVRR